MKGDDSEANGRAFRSPHAGKRSRDGRWACVRAVNARVPQDVALCWRTYPQVVADTLRVGLFRTVTSIQNPGTTVSGPFDVFM